MNGDPQYRGHCHECGEDTYTCYDELCESCAKDEPVKCPMCGDMVHPDHMTEEGCCILCLEYEAEERTISSTEFFNSLKIILEDYDKRGSISA